ncbi:MotE family protein [Thalassobius sp. MITS945101]|uniref:MotE family protein n=1 Tax=Thalassobius sp. MITS945101 TaxID=3096994 RepID=UPI003999B290
MSRRNGKGTLPLIAGLLLGSALLRVGIGAGDALAKAPASLPPDPEAIAETCPAGEDSAALLAVLQRRAARLDEDEAQMAQRKATLDLIDAEVRQQLAALEAAENSLAATIAVADTAAEADIVQLVAVYEAMKPKDAAALFSEMEPNFAAGFLSRMAPEAAAGVLAGMAPQTAYSISVLLAGRNAAAPKE